MKGGAKHLEDANPQKKCLHCGDILVGKQSKYCSEKCRGAYRRVHNAGSIKAAQVKHFELHKESEINRINKYREEHKEKQKNYMKIYRKQNLPELIKKEKLYNETVRKPARKIRTGILNPNTATGLALISEHIVKVALSDSSAYNENNLNAEYDLESESLGYINVKSSKLHAQKLSNNGRWSFSKNANSKEPNYYICVGFNPERTKIIKVWIIPGNTLFHKYGLKITNSIKGLKRALAYETCSEAYNEIYQQLNITELKAFKNVEQPIQNHGAC